jgi:hypothetical protein
LSSLIQLKRSSSKARKLRETKEGGIVLICLFLIQALVNRAVNKLETIHAQGVNFRKNIFSLLEIYQISDKENKSVSSVYVYVLVYSFVSCVFICLLGAKVGRKTIAWQEKGNNSFKKLS